jgi:hypothetical protein
LGANLKKFLLIQLVCFTHIFLFAQTQPTTPPQPQPTKPVVSPAPVTPPTTSTAPAASPEPAQKTTAVAQAENGPDGAKLPPDGTYTSYDGFPLEKIHWSALPGSKSLAELKNIAKEDLKKLTLDYFMEFEKAKGLPFNKKEIEKIVNNYYDYNYKPVDAIPVLQKRHTFLYFRSLITRLSLLYMIEYQKELAEKNNKVLTDKMNSLEKTIQLKTAPQQAPFLRMPINIYEFLVILAFLISFGLLTKELISRR